MLCRQRRPGEFPGKSGKSGDSHEWYSLKLFLAALVSIPFRQFVVLGDAVAPLIEGAPAYLFPLQFGFVVIPVIGIIATSERETDGVVRPVTLVPGDGCSNL